MDIRLKSLHFEASENLKTFVDEKVGKLFGHSDKILHAEVTLLEENRATDNQVCEIRLAVPGNDLFVKKASPLYEQSIMEAVETLQKIIRTQKEKETGRAGG